LVTEDSPVVQRLQEASRHICGEACPTVYPESTFDLGGLASAGIPAVMFGASGGRGGILGDDYISCREVIEEAKILACLIMRMCK
jgi:hypothetical protein